MTSTVLLPIVLTVKALPHLSRFRRLCACVLLGMATQAQALVVSLGDMNATDWAQTTITVVGSDATSSSTTQSTGGNPGSFWANRFDVGHLNVGLNQIRLANIFNAVAYDPRASGALSSLVFSFDMLVIASPFSTAGFLIPAIEQGGHFFRHTLGATQIDTTSWQSKTFDVGLASEWSEVGSSLKPDFSESGGILHFGYQSSMGVSCPSSRGCAAGTIVSGLDNFRVEAIGTTPPPPNGVPEPGSAALAILGLAAMFGQGRRYAKPSPEQFPKAAGARNRRG